ncbi:unnamed protein product, partial [Rotaria sp. Silwood1]
ASLLIQMQTTKIIARKTNIATLPTF